MTSAGQVRELPTRVAWRGRPVGAAVAVLFGASIVLMWIVSFLGASPAEPPLASHGALPPYQVQAAPSVWLVSGLLALAFVVAAAMLIIALRALRQGWRPPIRQLLLMGVIGTLAFVLCPTVGSADYTNYSAYGHIANRGLDPYAVTPLAAARVAVPTAAAVERPWQSTPSVYGPTSVWIERFAAWLAGPSLRWTALILTVMHALAYLATGLLLLGLARDDRGRRRVAIMWWANPLLIYELVAGSHVDAIVVLLIVAGFAVLRRSRSAAGAFVGLGFAAKVNAALVGAGMAWAHRRSPRRVMALAVGAVATIGALYLTASSHSLDQTIKAGRFVSATTPWWILYAGLRRVVGSGAAHLMITAGVVVVSIAIGRAILRLLPSHQDDTRESLRVSSAFSLAWLLGAPYLLPWYDALAWSTVSELDDGPLDTVLVVHTAVLALAALPGRALHYVGPFAVVSFIVRSVVTPLIITGLVVVVMRRGRRRPEEPRVTGDPALAWRPRPVPLEVAVPDEPVVESLPGADGRVVAREMGQGRPAGGQHGRAHRDARVVQQRSQHHGGAQGQQQRTGPGRVEQDASTPEQHEQWQRQREAQRVAPQTAHHRGLLARDGVSDVAAGQEPAQVALGLGPPGQVVGREDAQHHDGQATQQGQLPDPHPTRAPRDQEHPGSRHPGRHQADLVAQRRGAGQGEGAAGERHPGEGPTGRPVQPDGARHQHRPHGEAEGDVADAVEAPGDGG